MAKQIRAQLTLPQDLKDTLELNARLMGSPMSKVIVNLLRELKPVLDATNEALEHHQSPYAALLELGAMSKRKNAEVQADIEEEIKRQKTKKKSRK